MLYRGRYELTEAQIIGEGGLQVLNPFEMKDRDLMVLTFKIPHGPTLCLRGEVRNIDVDAEGRPIVGLEFTNISFDLKRAIRSYVAARLETESLIL